MKQKLNPYWILVLWHKRNLTNGIEEYESRKIVGPEVLLASSVEQARLSAVRTLDRDQDYDLEELEVLATPF